MNNIRIRKWILPILFMGTITVLSLVTFFGTHKTYSENEKRMLAEFPKFSLEAVMSGSYQKQLETYISDHISGRDFFVGVDTYFSHLMGRNALGDIYRSDGDYLINAPKNDSNGHFVKNMNNFEKFADKIGVPCSMIIVPSAGYIMEDRLPAFHGQYNDDKLFEKASDLTPSVKFFDARVPLIEAYNEGKQVYYRTDHHLTSSGTYELYKAYCDFAEINYPIESTYTKEIHGGFYGTTYSSSGYWMTEADNIELWDSGEKVCVTHDEDTKTKWDTVFFKTHLTKKDKYPVFLDGNHSYVKIENPGVKKGNLLIIRDSYAQCFAPFISHNYRNIYMLDMRYYRNSVLGLFEEKEIDEVLFLYGIDTLLTDSSTSWLMF